MASVSANTKFRTYGKQRRDTFRCCAREAGALVVIPARRSWSERRPPGLDGVSAPAFDVALQAAGVIPPMADEVVRCDACPVLCRIRPGKVGACDRYANEGGRLVRVDPLVITERAAATVPFLDAAAWDGALVRTEPFVTGIGAGVASVTLLLQGEWWVGVILGIAGVVMATLGDLAESLIKRDLGIKDMGDLLPGHGGLMDRLDSLVAVAPIAWLIMNYLVSPA